MRLFLDTKTRLFLPTSYLLTLASINGEHILDLLLKQAMLRDIRAISGDFIFTARCTLVQSAVLRSHVVCLSVCPSVCLSVTLVDCDHIRWNSSKIISPLVSLECSLFASPT